MSSEGYNGWANWDTWECYLVLSNDESSLEHAQELAGDKKYFVEWLADYVRQANWDYRDSICFNDIDIDETIEALTEE